MIPSMRKPGKRGTVAAALACLLSLGAAGSAQAADPIIAPPGAEFGNFSAATYNMAPGERPTLQNNDPGVDHDVLSRGRIGGGPLFLSPTITGPGSVLVNGTQYLNTGTYEFICNVHPLSMSATLNVSGAGSPQPRPKIVVKVLSGKIKRVANSRKARVRVRAVTTSTNVALALKLRNLRLGGKANINLQAGQKRVLTLKLSKRAKKKLSAKNRARVKLIGSVRFGPRATASKLLK